MCCCTRGMGHSGTAQGFSWGEQSRTRDPGVRSEPGEEYLRLRLRARACVPPAAHLADASLGWMPSLGLGVTSFPRLLHPQFLPVLIPSDLHLLLHHQHRSLENSVSSPKQDLPGGDLLSDITLPPSLSSPVSIGGPSVAEQL